MSIFNFDTNKWRQIRTQCFANLSIVIRPGICYSEVDNRLYIGGGGICKVHQYDPIKNRWNNNLPRIPRIYPMNTLLWFDKICPDLLFIANSWNQNMHYIDIR